MASYRLYSKTQTWFGFSGQLLAGGYCLFYEAGSLVPQDVYGDKWIGTNNGSRVNIDSSGRLEHDCWADTANSYFVEVYDSEDVKQGEEDYIEVPGGAGQVIPIPDPGEYLTGDGTQFIAVDLSASLLPDQTGHSNEILGTDGTTASWVARPADGADGTSDIATTATSFKVGTMLTQTGSATGTNSGGRLQSLSVTFPVAFDSAPIFVLPVVNNVSLSTYNNQPTVQVTAKSATGATFQFTLSELDDTNRGFDYNAGVQFDYIAIGVKA